MFVQKDNLLADDSDRAYIKNVKAYKSAERPKPYDVRLLFPRKSDLEVAESLANYFTEVSREFNPLSLDQIPVTYAKELPMLASHDVVARIRFFKKPKSMVKGDIFPCLMSMYSDSLAIPLRSIYNEIIRSKIRPLCWKWEFVTVIPKTTNPADISGLHNISCTLLASKIYESYVLNWATLEVKVKRNQYGGVRGCSTAHMLIETFQRIVGRPQSLLPLTSPKPSTAFPTSTA